MERAARPRYDFLSSPLLIGLLVLIGLGLTMTASRAALAGDDLVIKTSTRSVKETIDTLAAKLAEKGISIAARVDHAAGAKAAGLDLPPTELLIFGNPKLGTPLMQANRAIGLDLPMKVLAWEEADGTVKVAYTSPAALAKRHAITDQDKIIAAMSKALDGLTAAASGAKP